DLNDALYNAGDVVYFYFSARSLNNVTSYYSQFTGMTTDQNEVRAQPMEFTGLPSGGSNVLYVDYFSGYGAEPLFNSSFFQLGITPDRYDVRSPSSLGKNGPGNHVFSQDQLFVYDTLVLNSGWFSDEVIAPDDWLLLAVFAEYNTNSPAGIYLSGDNIAAMLATSQDPIASYLRSFYCDFSLISDTHRNIGLPVSPLVVPAPNSPFTGQFVAYGGAASPPGRFDVLKPGTNAVAAMTYEGDPGRAAAVVQSTVSPVTQGTVNFVLAGFSHHKIRDDEPAGIPDRTVFLKDVLDAVTGSGGTPTTANRPVSRDALEQNVPNPFNPVTTIRYSIARAGHVNLVVYNAAGQRVASLVNEVQQPRAAGYAVTWDGHADSGARVASGVYFYKLTSPGYSQTRKMVLLK
ncbi:MAG TPA: T9SS type A sorting domain-containing protein, partial [Candidatus Krumholzibacteria bacterium]|nr:T9SS type A sorting domain-containing protein [Candidatus Krumholzibacteria bacterium]